MIPSRQMLHAVRAIRARTNPPDHVHEFVEGRRCACRRTFDQALEADEPFVLELNPE